MRTVLATIAALWLLLTTSAAIAIGGSRAGGAPDDLQALGFDVCSDQPCFAGIVPGVTRVVDARRLFPPSAITYNDLSQITVTLPEKVINIFPGDETALVEWLNVRPNNTVVSLSLPLAAVVAHFGKPYGTAIERKRSSYMILRYPNAGASFSRNVDERAISIGAPQFFTVEDIAAFSACSRTPDVYTGPWLGFTSFAHYHVRVC